jgi:hypothetical protein
MRLNTTCTKVSVGIPNIMIRALSFAISVLDQSAFDKIRRPVTCIRQELCNSIKA